MINRTYRETDYPLYEGNGVELFNKGFTHVCIEQSGRGHYAIKSDSPDPKTHWGSGLYVLKADGTLGDCVHFNYDSSD